MSVSTLPAYRVQPCQWGFAVMNAGQIVEICVTRSAADYSARILNDGIARIAPHAIIGCRVVAA